jgi:uncharacterized membrane protein YheB (UPF0754 family)
MNKIFNKSFITNFLASLLIMAGYFSPMYAELIKTIGFFALSGALTNWLAVFMLFEKIPLLYGSGIIPNRFEEFKYSIKDLMMHQFFTAKNIEQFIQGEATQGSAVLNLDPLLAAVNYDQMFAGLVSSIMESSFGSMLQMMGGEEALIPLKEPFTAKMQLTLAEMVDSDKFKSALKQGLSTNQIGEDIISKIETVIDKRLDELTPKLVKEMVQKIIREHLGWLVVWGGIFGGIMGAAFSFV